MFRHVSFHCQARINKPCGSQLFLYYLVLNGPGSSVGIATGYGLDGPGIESRWGARFSAPVQTGPGAHPASCTMGTKSFPGVKSGLGVTLIPHLLLVPWSWKSRSIPLLPLLAVQLFTEPQYLYKDALYLTYLVLIYCFNYTIPT
jgi:hypothetical protein